MPKVESDRVIIFDTTLRDGEQSPGCSMNTKEKLKIASKLEAMGVDVIEAGFPAASPGDFEAVYEIAKASRRSQIAALCMANPKDIEQGWKAIECAGERGRIHTFIATSKIHLEHKLRMSEDEALDKAVVAVRRARSFTKNVEFSCEDATRSTMAFLIRILSSVIEAGARVVNIPDTVGYTTPHEYYKIIRTIKEMVPNIHEAIISVHCHNDLGLAVANSISAISAGARQVECTVNGIGERAGNCSLEEIVMAIKTRNDILPYSNNIITEHLVPVSKLLSGITGLQVQANKAIVGANAFAHEAGIHQHGVLNNKATYEIMTPESVGLKTNNIVLGKHSGRHAFRDRLNSLGHSLTKEALDKAFVKFKILCDQKKVVFDEDLDAIVFEETVNGNKYHLQDFMGTCGSFGKPSSMVLILYDDKVLRGESKGDGPVDAAFMAIKNATNTNFVLKTFAMEAVTEGSDALATCVVRLEGHGREFIGRGTDTDVVCSATKAYISALNKIKNWEIRYGEHAVIS